MACFDGKIGCLRSIIPQYAIAHFNWKMHCSKLGNTLIRNLTMDSFVTDTQALVMFMMGKKVINSRSHQAFQSADKGKSTIIIPAIVLVEVLYLFEVIFEKFKPQRHASLMTSLYLKSTTL
jgi:hypothetical protein